MKHIDHWSARIAEKSVLGLCLLASLAGVVASKAMTLLVILGGVSGLAALWYTNGLRPRVITVFSVTLSLLFLWAGLSSFWSLNEIGALNLCFRLIILCLAGFFLLQTSVTTAPETREKMQKALLVGYGLGLLALVIGYTYANIVGDSLWGSYYFDPLTTLNNGAVIIALLLLPVASVAWRVLNPLSAIIIFIAVSTGLLFFSSGASLLSIVVGLSAFILVYLFGRPAVLAIAVVSVGLILSAPLMANKLTGSATVQELIDQAPPSVKHRMLMWNFVSQKIAENPSIGLGFDSSRHIPQEDFQLAPNMEIMPLHPHNAALQIRMELGLPGVAIAAFFVFILFWSSLKNEKSREQTALWTSVLCAYLSIGAVSYGVWQSWWIATAWALAMIVGIAAPKTLPASHSQD